MKKLTFLITLDVEIEVEENASVSDAIGQIDASLEHLDTCRAEIREFDLFTEELI